MNTFSGRSRRRAALALSAATVSVIALAGCSETEEPVPAPGPAAPAAPTLGSLGELRGLTMIDTSWESYRTAKVTSVTGRPDARAVDVTYEASDATCEKLAGFAQRRTKTQLQVTIVIGRQDDCEPGTVKAATTSVPLTEPLGTLAPVASPYSEESVAIG
ncbi:hypothetical protein KV100_04265 [Mumia sp. zg.B21]|uniref:hypothetical protein n=1 Tax=Mumia sp. zg.B21 TaxID=2855447 RepID=UPI001C6F175F|nr:hypothetical protein [Mumia sp. zg.B21]MBW9208861.1 hypothetical protein [Mumia sp. zg.B21]